MPEPGVTIMVALTPTVLDAACVESEWVPNCSRLANASAGWGLSARPKRCRRRNPVRAGLRFVPQSHLSFELGVRAKIWPAVFAALRRWDRPFGWHPDLGVRIGFDALFGGLASLPTELAAYCS